VVPECAPPLGRSSSSIGVCCSPTTSFQLCRSLRGLLLPLLLLHLKLYTTSDEVSRAASVRFCIRHLSSGGSAGSITSARMGIYGQVWAIVLSPPLKPLAHIFHANAGAKR
jgi:hypothetical protein